ncbi:KRAB [Mytilus edulis]|uniref:KRAB n=1 Tax=Mytilus edulis TaxID=6550 RepID=A0A8S3R546_MYTED|nr:KRAB [Mytilus edulis]
MKGQEVKLVDACLADLKELGYKMIRNLIGIMMDDSIDVVCIKQEPVDSDIPPDLMNFGELNQLSKSIYQKLTEVFKQNGINSIKKTDSDKGKQDSVKSKDEEMYLLNGDSEFSGNNEVNTRLSNDNYLPCKELKTDGQNLNDPVDHVPGTSKVENSVLKNILTMEPNIDKLRKDYSDKTNNSEQNNVKFESYLYNDSKVFGCNKQNKTQPNKKNISKKRTSSSGKKKKTNTSSKKVLTKVKSTEKILKENEIKKEPISLPEDKDIDEEKKELDRLIKDEVMAGLIKTELAPPEPFDFSQVPDLPELATTHSEANQYMKSYMHSTIYSSDTVQIDKPSSCEYCGKVFVSGQNLVKHLEQHVGEVRIHLRGEHGGEMYNCQYCDREFLRYSNKMRHERIHLGIRPHECDVCGEKFFQRTELRDHKYKHEGIFPFPCDLCEKQFRKRSQFNMHRKIHTGEGIVECVPCNKKFNYKSSYTKHCESERHHKQEAIFNGRAIKKNKTASMKKTKSTLKGKRDDTESEDEIEDESIIDEEYYENDENSCTDEKNDDSDVDETNLKDIEKRNDSSDTTIDENYTSSLKEDKLKGGNPGMKIIIKRK